MYYKLTFYILGILLFAGQSAKSQDEITHALAFHLGLNQTLYKSVIPQSPDFSSHFLPLFALDYTKMSDNLFWGGMSIGISPRYLPMHQYPTGVKLGARYNEKWIRFRTGFKLESRFITHMPHISLGVALNSKSYDSYLYGGPNKVIFYNVADTTLNVNRFRPFLELGTILINTTYREDKRNVSIQMGVRIYPLHLFPQPHLLEYEQDAMKLIQYRIGDLYITGSIQQNFRKK